MTTNDIWLIDFACHDAACAPPPVGTGGSKGGASRGVLSPTAEGRSKVPTGRFSDLKDRSDSYFKQAFEARAGGLESIALSVTRYPTLIEIKGEIRDKTGTRVGEFSRQIIKSSRGGDETLRVEHDWMRLDDEAQGKGIAQAINDKSLAMYQEIGVDRITLHAALEVGPYAWARQGYRIQGAGEINNESTRKEWVRDRAVSMRYAVDAAPGIDDTVRAEYKKRITALMNASSRGEDVQPLHVASIGQDDPRVHWQDPKFGDMWPGKAVLVKTGYSNPESSYRTFHGVFYLEGT